MKRIIFNHRQRAIYKHVWKLTKEDIIKLDAYFLCYASGEDLDDRLIDPKNSLDSYCLEYSSLMLSVAFIGSLDVFNILGDKDQRVLISIRLSTINRLYHAIIMPAHPDTNFSQIKAFEDAETIAINNSILRKERQS